MNSLEKLEIILVTYNREKYLANTFRQIFAENSPIKDFPICILDNKSTDGTVDLIKSYQEKFPNIKHVVHNRNIGGNANILRAFEIASKEYLWVLCDDDEFDFTHWKDVEKAIADDYDAVVVSNYLKPKKNIAQLVGQMTFVPSTIYKTYHFTDTVMSNGAFSISDMFPQMAFITKLINDNLRIKILDNWIVNMVDNHDASYTRGLDDNKHPVMRDKTWQTGFISALQMIKSDETRKEIIKNFDMNENTNNFLSKKRFLEVNKATGNNSLWNMASTYAHYATLYGEDEINIVMNPNEMSDVKHLIGLYLTIYGLRLKVGAVRISLWDKRWFRFYRSEKGIYCQIAKKIKFKIFSTKKKSL